MSVTRPADVDTRRLEALIACGERSALNKYRPGAPFLVGLSHMGLVGDLVTDELVREFADTFAAAGWFVWARRYTRSKDLKRAQWNLQIAMCDCDFHPKSMNAKTFSSVWDGRDQGASHERLIARPPGWPDQIWDGSEP